MSYSIITPQPVLNDILSISRWYDLQMAGLSKAFESRLDEAIEKLRIHPQSFSYTYFGCRKIKLKKFPYFIFYKLSEQEVKLYAGNAVIHTKRSINFMKNKLRKLGF